MNDEAREFWNKVTYLDVAKTTLSGICWRNGRKGLGGKGGTHVRVSYWLKLSSYFNISSLKNQWVWLNWKEVSNIPSFVYMKPLEMFLSKMQILRSDPEIQAVSGAAEDSASSVCMLPSPPQPHIQKHVCTRASSTYQSPATSQVLETFWNDQGLRLKPPPPPKSLRICIYFR